MAIVPVDVGLVIVASEVDESSLLCVDEIEEDSTGDIDVALLV